VANLGGEHLAASVMITNTTYAYQAMKNGDDGNIVPFCKQFGGVTGNDQDWFKLTIVGKNGINITGQIDFYLADYRFADNAQDYVIDQWTEVDLSSLGLVTSLEFSVASSDYGTPTYFAMDNLNIVPEPATMSLLAIGVLALRRRRNA
jgi:hypothetical protein